MEGIGTGSNGTGGRGSVLGNPATAAATGSQTAPQGGADRYEGGGYGAKRATADGTRLGTSDTEEPPEYCQPGPAQKKMKGWGMRTRGLPRWLVRSPQVSARAVARAKT